MVYTIMWCLSIIKNWCMDPFKVRIIWDYLTFNTLISKSSSPAAGPMSSGARISEDRFAGGAALDSGAGRLVAIIYRADFSPHA